MGLKIAFLVLAHRNAEQVARLCTRLTPHKVFVHVDKRAVNFASDRLTGELTPRIAVYWADYSVVEATLLLLRQAHAAGPFDRYVLLSGECYPAKPIAALENAFQSDPEREWIAITPIVKGSHLENMVGRHWRMAPILKAGGLDVRVRRIMNAASKVRGRGISSEIGMRPYFGSQWFGLSSACVSMVLQFISRHPAMAEAYRSVYAPDEHFFQTIIGNSEFAGRTFRVADNGIATNQSAPLHQIAPSEDRYFRTADFALAGGTDRHFLRKVSPINSGELLDRIDRELLN